MRAGRHRTRLCYTGPASAAACAACLCPSLHASPEAPDCKHVADTCAGGRVMGTGGQGAARTCVWCVFSHARECFGL